MAISIIIPMRNASVWLDNFFSSILNQQLLYCPGIPIELSFYEDGSSVDESAIFLESVYKTFLQRVHNNLKIYISGECGILPEGCGYGKNVAIRQCTGKVLLFSDIDDMLLPERTVKVLSLFCFGGGDPMCCLSFGRNLSFTRCVLHGQRLNAETLCGSQFLRRPLDATIRYSNWAHKLSANELFCEAFTPHGPTLLMPTWAILRDTFVTVGDFSEISPGYPEDLDWFMRHLFNHKGALVLIPHVLVVYTYHQSATTFSVSDETILRLRVAYLEKYVVPNWSTLSLWGYRYARQVYKLLSDISKVKVNAFLDVSPRLIGNKYLGIPIKHWSTAEPPLLICVKRNLTGGEQFERNLYQATKNIVKGVHFLHIA